MTRTSINLTNLRHGHSNFPKFNDRFNAYQEDGYVLQVNYTITKVETKGKWRKWFCTTDDGQNFNITHRIFPDGTIQGIGYINEMIS